MQIFAPMNGKSAFFYTPRSDGSEPPNGKRGGVFRRARNSKNDIRALTRCACRKTGFGIGRPTSRLPLPGKLFLRSAFPHARGAKCWPVCGPETPSRPARFPISFFDASVGCEHTNVILAVSCAFEKCHSFAVLRPQARAEANRAQARLLGRRLGSGAIGVTR